MIDEQIAGRGIELRCARCDQVVSCDGVGSGYIATELAEADDLGFTALISAMILSGWEFTVEQLVIDGNPRIALRGQPVDQSGRVRLDMRDVTAVWERRPNGWVLGTRMTGHQAIDGGPFIAATVNELATLVNHSPASWTRVPHRRGPESRTGEPAPIPLARIGVRPSETSNRRAVIA